MAIAHYSAVNVFLISVISEIAFFEYIVRSHNNCLLLLLIVCIGSTCSCTNCCPDYSRPCTGRSTSSCPARPSGNCAPYAANYSANDWKYKSIPITAPAMPPKIAPPIPPAIPPATPPATPPVVPPTAVPAATLFFLLMRFPG